MAGMGRPLLRVVSRADAPIPEDDRPLLEHLPPGKLVELSGSTDSPHPPARMTTATSILRSVQAEGDTAAWIQSEGGPLFPPDLHLGGVDLDALVVVHVPTRGERSGERASGPHLLCKAAELLLRSGAFGLVIVDLSEGAPPAGTEAWQGRLSALARQHHARVVLITDKPAQSDSLGTLVGLRIEPQRTRERPGRFVVRYEVIKNKSGRPFEPPSDLYQGPWGLT